MALPVEKPLPVQEVALADDHERVDDWLLVRDVGLAVRDAIGEETAVEASTSNCCVNHAVAAPLDDVEPEGVPLDAIAL